MSDLDKFIAELTKITLPNSFNPYKETCPTHDVRGAPAIRRNNLRLVLEAGLANGTRSLWIGRDLGYRGGRRTGVPLTDELSLQLLGTRCGISGLAKSTRTPATVERTATDVWNVIARIDEVPLFWNAFPYHPYKPGEPGSNRRHTSHEAEVTTHLLRQLLQLVEPSRLIALGGDAHKMLAKMGLSAVGVRHPSFGGQADFRLGIEHAYR